MATGVRDKYHVAINSKGYILRGAPERPAYKREVLASQVDRLAISDISYSDFAGQTLFYLAQTDWSAGIKDDRTWKDDGKFYYSTNIDAHSKLGSIKLSSGLTLKKDFTENINCGIYGSVAGTSYHYIGTNDTGSTKPAVYRSSDGTTFSDISSSAISDLRTDVSCLRVVNSALWITTLGVNQTDVVQSYDGTSFTDHSAAILAASTLVSVLNSSCVLDVGSDIYAGVSGGKTLANTGEKATTAYVTANWNNPTYAYADDSNRATTTVAGLVQDYRTFDLSAIPVGALITGVEVKAKGQGNAADMVLSAKISGDGGVNWASAWKIDTPNNGSDTTLTFGANNDTWGLNILRDEIWTDNLFVRLNCSDLGSGTTYSLNYLTVIVYYTTTYGTSLMKYSASAWSELAHWSETSTIFDMEEYNGDVYYLKGTSAGLVELRKYDVSASADVGVQLFRCDSMSNVAGANRYLRTFNGSLVITIPSTEIWKLTETTTGTTINRIWNRDDAKNTIGEEATGDITYGCIEHDHKLWWSNLIYDGEYFFNNTKDFSDTTDVFNIPIYTDLSTIKWSSTTDITKLYGDNGYKSGSNKNYLIFNEMSPIASIDKLFATVSLMFDALATGQSIRVDYSKDDMANWTTIGILTPSTEGSNTKRTFAIPSSVLWNKIWFKVYLNGPGTTTPTLNDLVLAYKPMPDYKNRWSMILNFSESVKLLNGQDEQKTAEDLTSQLWNEKLTKQRVTFEDIDYVECTLQTAMTSAQVSASVNYAGKLPLKGRIRAVSGGVAEEMSYTSAQSKKILGITRGLRGTRARAYLSGQVFKNDYDVYIEDISTQINFTDEKKTESIAQVLLIEA
jgi:hypothetical protein